MMKAALLSTALLSTTACATVLSGTQQRLAVETSPPGAKVYVNDKLRGTTPLTVEVDRRWDQHALRLVMDGYRPVETTIPRSFNFTALLNVFVPPGFIVDTATGAIFKYSEGVTFDLESQNLSASTVSGRASSMASRR